MSHRLVLPQTKAPVCPGLAERRGGFARGRASTPIRTWSARALAPPPGTCQRSPKSAVYDQLVIPFRSQ